MLTKNRTNFFFMPRHRDDDDDQKKRSKRVRKLSQTERRTWNCWRKKQLLSWNSLCTNTISRAKRLKLCERVELNWRKKITLCKLNHQRFWEICSWDLYWINFDRRLSPLRPLLSTFGRTKGPKLHHLAKTLRRKQKMAFVGRPEIFFHFFSMNLTFSAFFSIKLHIFDTYAC